MAKWYIAQIAIQANWTDKCILFNIELHILQKRGERHPYLRCQLSYMISLRCLSCNRKWIANNNKHRSNHKQAGGYLLMLCSLVKHYFPEVFIECCLASLVVCVVCNTIPCFCLLVCVVPLSYPLSFFWCEYTSNVPTVPSTPSPEPVYKHCDQQQQQTTARSTISGTTKPALKLFQP